MAVVLSNVLNTSPVIPVMVVEEFEQAVPLARALTRGGLRVLEVTLRTPVALDAVKVIKQEIPELIVGAGTVITPADVTAAVTAGADFLVSPGATTRLVDAALDAEVPLLPGISSPSEAMALYERGFDHLKFFPAEAAGGVAMLKSIAGPLPQLTFCPTGGINAAKAKEYLALANVACVGGSWMVSPAMVKDACWDEIEKQAAAAASLG